MEDDKTASWLVIITFLALATAILFAVFHLIELKDQALFTTTSVF
jgi:predicted membrane channel-forming protein YqfA (hemolysin III family)